MLQHLKLPDFIALAQHAKRVAVYREISADRLTPIGIAECLAKELEDGSLLESAIEHQKDSRYAYLAFGTLAKITAKNGLVTRSLGTNTIERNTHPFTIVRQVLTELNCVSNLPETTFLHGAIGLVTYDSIRLFETIPDRHVATHPIPDMVFHFYHTTLLFDPIKNTILISIIVEVDDHLESCYQTVQDNITALILKITQPIPKTTVQSISCETTEVSVDIDDEQFIRMIAKAKDYIAAGDAFQIVLSRCFSKSYTVSPFDIYRALRHVSPAPYLFYIPIDGGFIVGASPEKMISVHKGTIEITPIAGTCPRTSNKKDDEQHAKALLSNDKELAEHMMLVDLARNDLGIVCKPGSIEVSELLKVKHFSHVSHVTSAVTGQLQDDKDALDALAATFPAGTLSGAPKIRAMELIDELETSKRGLYGGAICRIDYQGNLDSCIAIRMAVLRDQTATVRTGAGIVHDSDPQSEADETRQKARGVLDAITFAQEYF